MGSRKEKGAWGRNNGEQVAESRVGERKGDRGRREKKQMENLVKKNSASNGYFHL